MCAMNAPLISQCSGLHPHLKTKDSPVTGLKLCLETIRLVMHREDQACYVAAADLLNHVHRYLIIKSLRACGQLTVNETGSF